MLWRLWLSCLCLLNYLPSQILRLFSFPIFWHERIDKFVVLTRYLRLHWYSLLQLQFGSLIYFVYKNKNVFIWIHCLPCGAHKLTPMFTRVAVTRSLVFCVTFCRSLFVLLSFFFWPLCCLSFFDLRILITPLVS